MVDLNIESHSPKIEVHLPNSEVNYIERLDFRLVVSMFDMNQVSGSGAASSVVDCNPGLSGGRLRPSL